MLAEVVLRPPDVRHLDAAFQGLAASPRRESSLKVSIGDLFATRCATCGRTLVIDEVIWSVDDEAGVAGRARPVARHYRCTVCRDQRGGSEQRQAPLDADDLRRATADVGARGDARLASLAFPRHRRRGDAPRRAARPAHAAPARRPRRDPRADRGGPAGRPGPRRAPSRPAPFDPAGQPPGDRSGAAASVRVSSGHVRPQSGIQFRERNPWLAFEDAFRGVRGFIQRLESGTAGPIQARLGEDLRSLGEGTATAVLGLASASGLLLLRDDPTAYGRTAPTPRVRLVLGQPPMRQTLDRLAAAYHATAWVLGREAAGLLPIDALAGSSLRPPWSWQAAADRARPRGGRTVDGARRPGHPAGRRRAGGHRRGGDGWRVGGLPAARRADVGSRRGRGRHRRAAATRRTPPAGTADAGERRSRSAARRCGRPRPRSGQGPVRATGTLRPATVLGGRRRAHRDRDGGRDAARPGRTRPLRAAARRDPRRVGPGRTAAPPGQRDPCAVGRHGRSRRRRRAAIGRRPSGHRRRPRRGSPRRRSRRRSRRRRPARRSSARHRRIRRRSPGARGECGRERAVVGVPPAVRGLAAGAPAPAAGARRAIGTRIRIPWSACWPSSARSLAVRPSGA